MPEIPPNIIELGTSYAIRVVGVLVALFFAWIVAGSFKKLVGKTCDKAKVDPTLGKFFANATRYAIILMAVIACLGVFGIETTSFAAVIGAAGLAIGLAFQGSLSNLASGVMLLLFRPFKVGDCVNIVGKVGLIDEIELFTTKLITFDNRLIIIPNSAIFGSTIENINAFDTRRCDITVGVAYDADIDEARSVLQSVADSVGGLTEPAAPQVYLAELGASSVDFAIRIWVNTPDYWAVREKLTHDVKKALDDKGIGIPFPQMDVHFDDKVVEAFKKSA